jgi:hypothetical protein
LGFKRRLRTAHSVFKLKNISSLATLKPFGVPHSSLSALASVKLVQVE